MASSLTTWSALCLGRGVQVIKTFGGGLIALNKPIGVLSHPNKAPAEKNSKTISSRNSVLINGTYNYEKEYFNVSYLNEITNKTESMKTWLLHRLDKDTSGLMLVSTNSKLAKEIKKLFQKREIHKEYYAILCGCNVLSSSKKRSPSPASSSSAKKQTEDIWMDTYTKEHHTNFVRAKAHSTRDHREEGVTAITKVVVEAEDLQNQLTLVKFLPQTGYSHQLRYQAAIRGYPILGDSVYGNFPRNKELGVKRLYLHSFSLSFPESTLQSLESSTITPPDSHETLKAPTASASSWCTISTPFPAEFQLNAFTVKKDIPKKPSPSPLL